ncbi:MAG: DUF4351 domain-containing protein [Magnetococcales bacterium]|nr:DUF4351 domain-containing protein [Magnetococcales bacterium]
MIKQTSQRQTDEYDSPWKEVTKTCFKEFLVFFLCVAHDEIDWNRPVEFLDQEFSRIVKQADSKDRRVDLLAKVWLLKGGEIWVLIHVEVHGNRTADFAERMNTVQSRVRDFYNKSVVALAILADEEPSWRPSEYVYEMWGTKLSYQFTTIKLLDYLNRLPELEASINPFAMVVLAHLQAKKTKHQPQTRYQERWRITRGLYQRGFSREQISNLYKFIEWVMSLPAEMEERFLKELISFEEESKMQYVTYAERSGIQKGEANVLLRLLQRRFGQAPDPIKTKITEASLEQLETWTDRILDAKSIDDVFAN